MNTGLIAPNLFNSLLLLTGQIIGKMKINGELQYKIQRGGGIDEDTGDNIKVESIFSDPIPCQIIKNTRNNKGRYINGVFTIQSYEILIESQEFNANYVKLINDRGRELGVFTVQDIEYLDTVGRVKISV